MGLGALCLVGAADRTDCRGIAAAADAMPVAVGRNDMAAAVTAITDRLLTE